MARAHLGGRPAFRIGVVLSFLVVVAAAYASPATKACVRQSCRPGLKACAGAFRQTTQGALVACAQAGSKSTKRACRRQAQASFRAGAAACRSSMRDCVACCRAAGTSCHVGVCGNALLEPDEACDGSARGSCSAGCRADCTCETAAPVCGNGTREAAEECDGADDGRCPDRCRSNCTCEPAPPPPVCGDGVRAGTEACDGADAATCPGRCRPDCTCAPPPPPPPTCGDDLRAGTEACDGTDDAACPGLCRADCTCPPATCGDGVIDAGEGCDPAITEGPCPGLCLPNCTCAVCGDGIIEAPVEECDGTNAAACPGLCSPTRCNCVSATTDTCEEPHLIDTLPAVDRQDTTNATSAIADPPFACTGDPGNGDRSVWYLLTAPATGRVRVDSVDSTVDTLLNAYVGTCNALQPIACSYMTDALLRGRLDFSVTQGASYLIEAAGYAGNPPGEIVLTVDLVPCGDGIVDPGEQCDPGADTCATGACTPECECLPVATDECADAAVAMTLPLAVSVGAWNITGNATDPKLACARQPANPVPSAWFRFRAPMDGIVDVDTGGSEFDTVLGVFTGSCGALASVGCDDDGGSNLTSLLSVPVTAGVDYTVVVTPWLHVFPGRLSLSIAYEPPQ